MKTKRLAVLAVICAALAACSELASESEYGALQDIEYESRGLKISDVRIVVVHEQYHVAGFPSDDGVENVWVLLNPKYSPYYKQIPQRQFSIAKSTLQVVERDVTLSDTVRAVLETRMRVTPSAASLSTTASSPSSGSHSANDETSRPPESK